MTIVVFAEVKRLYNTCYSLVQEWEISGIMFWIDCRLIIVQEVGKKNSTELLIVVIEKVGEVKS